MKQIRRESHIHFWLLLAALLLLVTVRYSLQIDIPRAVYLVIIVLICLLGDQNEILAMLMCCIPLHESIDFFYALVFCIAIYVFKCRKRIRINIGLVLILVMILWELLHCFMHDFSIMNLICNIVPLAVLGVIMCSDLSEMDYSFLVRALAIATLGVFICLLSKVLYFSGFNIALAVAGLQRLGLDTAEASEQVTVAGGQINPNTLGIIGVLAATGLMQLRSVGKGSVSDLVMACVIMVFGALTASRTYLVCLALMTILLLFGQQGSLSQKMRFMGLLILLILLALGLLYVLFPDLLMYYISRFFVADITTGRLDTMDLYQEYILSNPDVLLFGIGLQSFGDRLVYEMMIASVVPHNAIQEIIIAWGMPGIALFIALCLFLIDSSQKSIPNKNLLNYIPLFIILFKGLAGQMLSSSYSLLALSFAYLSLCTNLTLVSKPKGG